MNILMQNIIQAIRSLRTQGWQVAISSVSLAVGIVCLAFSANWFWVETNYDCHRPGDGNLYFMQERNDSVTDFAKDFFSYRLLNEMKQQLPMNGFSMGIVTTADVSKKVFASADNRNRQAFSQFIMDSCAADILGVRALHGSMEEVFNGAPENVIITDKAAMRMLGRTDVVGETLAEMENNSATSKVVKLYTIKAVCEAYEENTNFMYDIIAPLIPDTKDINEYNTARYKCIIRTDNVERTMEQLKLYRRPEGIKGGNWGVFHFKLDDLTDFMAANLSPDGEWTMHLYPIGVAKRVPALINPAGTTSYLDVFFQVYLYNIIFTIVSLLLVISAVTNLIMVFTSINLARVREYALRRSMGATSWQNVQWILIGIMPTLLIALMLSGVIMEWIVKLADISWDMTYINTFLYLTEAAVVLLCLLGMAYPVWMMRRAYKASFLGHGDGGRSHQWLIVVQCVVCAFLLFISLGMQRQIYGMLNDDMGYDHDNMLRLHTGTEKPEGYDLYHDFSGIYRDLTNEIKNESGAGITDALAVQTDFIAVRSHFLGWHVTFMANFIDAEEYEESKRTRAEENLPSSNVKTHFMRVIEIPFRAVDFFNMRTESGQKLHMDSRNPEDWQVYMNAEAAKELSINKVYLQYMNEHRSHITGPLRIKGVAALRQADCFSVPQPMLIIGVDEFHECTKPRHDAIYIKYADGRREDAEAAVRKVLAKFDVPEGQYQLTTVEEHIAGKYDKETFIADMLTTLTTFSVVITLAGVFSMLLYSLRLRRRSMAIHRVMGATFSDIFVPTVRPYLIYAVVGAVVAYFPAQKLMDKWMEFFHYGDAPSVWLMIAILAAMLGIIFLIVWWQVSVCMKEKPVEILKPEA